MKPNSKPPKPNSQPSRYSKPAPSLQDGAEKITLETAVIQFLKERTLEEKDLLHAWITHVGNPMATYQVFAIEYGEKFFKLVHAVQEMATASKTDFVTVQDELYLRLQDDSSFADSLLPDAAPSQNGAAEVVRSSVNEVVCPYSNTISSNPPTSSSNPPSSPPAFVDDEKSQLFDLRDLLGHSGEAALTSEPMRDLNDYVDLFLRNTSEEKRQRIMGALVAGPDLTDIEIPVDDAVSSISKMLYFSNIGGHSLEEIRNTLAEKLGVIPAPDWVEKPVTETANLAPEVQTFTANPIAPKDNEITESKEDRILHNKVSQFMGELSDKQKMMLPDIKGLDPDDREKVIELSHKYNGDFAELTDLYTALKKLAREHRCPLKHLENLIADKLDAEKNH